MSVGVVNKSTGDRIQTAGDPLDKVGNLANLTTTAKDNAVNAINEVNATKANQTQLATVEASTTASKAYSANEYLVLGGVLYKVTANIAQGGTIVTEGAGKNVDLATVGGELSAINSNISTLESGLTNLTPITDLVIRRDAVVSGNKVTWAHHCTGFVIWAAAGMGSGSGILSVGADNTEIVYTSLSYNYGIDISASDFDWANGELEFKRSFIQFVAIRLTLT